MWTTAMIRRHINLNIPHGRPFSTREFLAYGLRAAIDQALYRMVKDGEILRLARGIFVKCKSGIPLPDMQAVAQTKAKAFGKELLTHGSRAAAQFGLLNQNPTKTIFAVLGGKTNSSFQFGKVRIEMKGTCGKDASLKDTKPGLAIRALRFLKRSEQASENLRVIMQQLSRIDKEAMHRATHLMPAWLSNMVYLLTPNFWWNNKYIC